MAEGRHLEGHEELSQYGMRTARGMEFHNALRAGWEEDVSLILGEVSADEAARIVHRPRRAAAIPAERHAVRYTTVGRLRDNGFEVCHTPGKNTPKHVSVTYGQPGVQWPKEVSMLFDSCFEDASHD